MKIPKKIKVGPLTYEVFVSKDVTNEGDCWGSTHYRTQKIFLTPDSKEDHREETFVHELLHACLETSGLNFRIEEKDKYPSAEEIVRTTATILYQVIKDNPKIFK